jgi:hypothetical protein
MIVDDFPKRIEIFMSNKAELEATEKILKASNIDYKITSSNIRKSKITRLIYSKSLSQVHDLLAESNKGYLEYINQFKKDLEARRYWRKKFQRFKILQKD